MSAAFDADDEQEIRNFRREAAQDMLAVLYPAVVHVSQAQSVKIGLAQIRFSLDLEERSMRDVAASLGVTVACISKGAKEFVRENNLPTPRCMKSEEASGTYREVRNSQLVKPVDAA